jgi:uncharacterized protein (DUF58 family)
MAERPSARYGRSRQSRRNRRWVIVGLTALILAAGLAVAVVGYQRLGRTDVAGALSGYRLIDGETVEVTMTVTRADPSRPAVCIVRARSKNGSETGRREVLVRPSTQESVQVTTIVKTSRPAAMGDVYGCGLDVPAYLIAP